MAFEYKAYASLELKEPMTLKDLEDFCKEARKFGVGENATLHTTRQGLMGPIRCWYFNVPIAK